MNLPAFQKAALVKVSLQTAVLMLCLLSPGLFAEDIPISKELAAAVRPISTDEEVAIGREVAANVIAQFGIVQNESLTEYVNLVGLAVAQSSPRRDVTYRFAVLDADILNAFAAPGGYIFITKGLLNCLKDEAQLAGVLGHEIAHVSQKHIIKEMQKSRIVQASIPSYVKATAKQAEWMSQVTDLAIQMLWKGFSREDELESDKLGLEYASSSGYDPKAYKEVLEMLNLKIASPETKTAKEVKFLLSTHPQPENRISTIEEKIKSIPAGGEKLAERFRKNVTGL